MSCLPPGEYLHDESYCNDPSCDCRRVFINVFHKEKIVATIGYGWDSLGFYKQWIGDPDLAQDVKGPMLEPGGTQTEYARPLLELFRKVMLNDRTFIRRLEQHYLLFKQELGKGKGGRMRAQSLQQGAERGRAGPERVKVGRNEPCPCGSGRKYKKCCLLKERAAA